MTGDAPSPERLAEVTRLCTLLADRALDAQIMKRPVPGEQVAALAKAARLLQDHGVEWPPLLSQVVHEFERAAEAAVPAPERSDTLAEAVRGSLARFFAKPRAEPEPS